MFHTEAATMRALVALPVHLFRHASHGLADKTYLHCGAMLSTKYAASSKPKQWLAVSGGRWRSHTC